MRSAAEQLTSKLAHVRQRLTPHQIPLVAVSVAIIIGQFMTFHAHPLYSVFTGDTDDYLNVAQKMLTSFTPFDPARTPTYPLLLAIIFGVTGGVHLPAVVVVQTGFMIHALYMIYILMFRLSRNKWLAMSVVMVLAINTYMLNWEREILSETLTMWLLVLAFVLVERYLRVQRPRYLIALTAVLTCCYFARPFFVYLPAIFFGLLVLQSLRGQQLRRNWKQLLAAMLISYGLLGGFIVGNGLQYHYYGISYISTVNLFGKVMEYHMQTEITDPQFTVYSQDVDTFVAAGEGGAPFVFLNHRYSQYSGNFYAFPAQYAKDIILHHPAEFSRHSLKDTWLAMALPQVYYDQLHHDPRWYIPAVAVIRLSMVAYLFLPAICIWALVWWWKKPRSRVALMLVMLSLTQLVALLEIGFASYDYPYRLRMPLDWSMVAMAGIGLVAAYQWLRRRLAQRRAVLERDGELVPLQAEGITSHRTK